MAMTFFGIYNGILDANTLVEQYDMVLVYHEWHSAILYTS